MALIARFPHHDKGVSRSGAFVDTLVATAGAMKPLLNLLVEA